MLKLQRKIRSKCLPNLNKISLKIEEYIFAFQNNGHFKRQNRQNLLLIEMADHCRFDLEFKLVLFIICGCFVVLQA